MSSMTTDPLSQAAMRDTDGVLVRRVLAGDSEEYRALIGRYLRIVQAYFAAQWRLRGDNLDEAVHRTFVEAYRGLARLNDPERFAPYLMRIASRSSGQRDRERGRSVPLGDLDPPARPQTDGDPWREELLAALGRLPEEMQQILALKYREELSAQEIASRLGRPLGSITKTLSRAYRLLASDPRLERGFE
jgi:RNA polymerase sigma-70 factor, ECF subfamily